MDCPYLPRTLIFVLIELVSTEDTPLLAFKYWVSQEGKTQDQIFSRTVQQVGCASASVRCKVRTISSTFIGRPDLRMPYRAPFCMCACMTVRL